MKKRIPSVAVQARKGVAELDKWAKGETRFRITLATKDGSRNTFQATRDELKEKLGRADFLKSIRTELKLSQPGFARLLHTGVSALRQWEQGRRAIPDPVLALADIARAIPKARKRLESAMVPMVPTAGGSQKRASSASHGI